MTRRLYNDKVIYMYFYSFIPLIHAILAIHDPYWSTQNIPGGSAKAPAE